MEPGCHADGKDIECVILGEYQCVSDVGYLVMCLSVGIWQWVSHLEVATHLVHSSSVAARPQERVPLG